MTINEWLEFYHTEITQIEFLFAVILLLLQSYFLCITYIGEKDD